MKNMNLKITATVLLSALFLGACTNELDQTNPATESNPTADELYSTPESYMLNLAKLYGGLATTGQQGPAGSPDISGIDEGASQYIRGLFYLNELTTDEALIGWNDNTIKDFHYQTWSSTDGFINGMFSRLDFQIKNCNEFLRQTTDAKLDSRGVTADIRAEIAYYRAEARFLRALSYWHFLDLFGGRVGLVTEDDPSTYFLPEQATAQEMYDYIDTELTAIEPLLKAPRTNTYPRADQAAAWMLHAKLYINAKVYTGVEKYAEAMPLLTNVINGGYSLNPNYRNLFKADNDRNGSQSENIFSVAFDGLATKTYGGTTFLVHAPGGGKMIATDLGVNGGWGGVRTTASFAEKFGANNGSFTVYDHDAAFRLITIDPATVSLPNNPGVKKAFDAEGDFEYLGTTNSGTNPAFNPNTVYVFNYDTGVITNNGATVAAPSRAVSLGSQFTWSDKRSTLFNNGQTLEISDISDFSNGYGIVKFRNVTVNNVAGSDASGDFVDNDFPMFRLADAYLMYAECAIRTGQGLGDALNYVNLVRSRAYSGTAAGNIGASSLNLNFILDERARELHFECHRRTDLIRFGKFTGGTYIWAYKGNTPNGSPTPSFRNIFPIPTSALAANPTLTQNRGY